MSGGKFNALLNKARTIPDSVRRALSDSAMDLDGPRQRGPSQSQSQAPLLPNTPSTKTISPFRMTEDKRGAPLAALFDAHARIKNGRRVYETPPSFSTTVRIEYIIEKSKKSRDVGAREVCPAVGLWVGAADVGVKVGASVVNTSHSLVWAH